MQTIPAFTPQPQSIIGRYQLILLDEQRHIGVRNLPRVFTPRSRPRLEPTTSWSQVQHSTDSATTPPPNHHFLNLTLKHCENERNTAISLKCIVSRNSVPVYTTDVGYNSQSDLWVTACNCPMLSHSLAVLQNWLVYQRHHHQRRCRQSCTHSICQNSLCNDRSIHQRYDTTLCLCRVGGKK